MSARASDAAIDERSSTLALVGAAGGGAAPKPKVPKAPKAAAPPKPPAAAKKGKGKKKEKVEIAMEPALPLAELLGSTNFPQTDGEYYVTTAINYANGAAPTWKSNFWRPTPSTRWRGTHWSMPHRCPAHGPRLRSFSY